MSKPEDKTMLGDVPPEVKAAIEKASQKTSDGRGPQSPPEARTMIAEDAQVPGVTTAAKKPAVKMPPSRPGGMASGAPPEAPPPPTAARPLHGHGQRLWP